MGCRVSSIGPNCKTRLGGPCIDRVTYFLTQPSLKDTGLGQAQSSLNYLQRKVAQVLKKRHKGSYSCRSARVSSTLVELVVNPKIHFWKTQVAARTQGVVLARVCPPFLLHGVPSSLRHPRNVVLAAVGCAFVLAVSSSSQQQVEQILVLCFYFILFSFTKLVPVTCEYTPWSMRVSSVHLLPSLEPLDQTTHFQSGLSLKY